MNWNVSVVDFLEYGLPGFAVVLLFLGYRLLANFQSKIAGRVPDFESREQIEAWKQAARAVSVNARCFMALSAFFFIGGFIMALVAPQTRIYLNVQPPEGFRPKVTLVGEDKPLNENGMVPLIVKNDSFIHVLNNELISTLNELSRQREDLRNQLRAYIAAAEADSDEAGF